MMHLSLRHEASHLRHDVGVWVAEELVYHSCVVQQAAQTHQHGLV
jgi:hypothetical protein